MRAWLSAALPLNVLGTVPALLLWFTRDADAFGWRLSSWTDASLWLALACLGVGFPLLRATISRFDAEGDGTLAPWDPTRKLVVSGPYRHVRNPMISGVVFSLLGEALLLRSPAVGCWGALFFLVNAVYFPISEEPGLEKRFGEDYRRYKRAVPRWIPRWRPWDPDSDGG
jgi:protein-S-isoprenylcysteine O-methyltransferase Ste14